MARYQLYVSQDGDPARKSIIEDESWDSLLRYIRCLRQSGNRIRPVRVELRP